MAAPDPGKMKVPWEKLGCLCTVPLKDQNTNPNMPTDVLGCIIGHLGLYDLSNWSMVCKSLVPLVSNIKLKKFGRLDADGQVTPDLSKLLHAKDNTNDENEVAYYSKIVSSMNPHPFDRSTRPLYLSEGCDYSHLPYLAYSNGLLAGDTIIRELVKMPGQEDIVMQLANLNPTWVTQIAVWDAFAVGASKDLLRVLLDSVKSDPDISKNVVTAMEFTYEILNGQFGDRENVLERARQLRFISCGLLCTMVDRRLFDVALTVVEQHRKIDLLGGFSSAMLWRKLLSIGKDGRSIAAALRDRGIGKAVIVLNPATTFTNSTLHSDAHFWNLALEQSLKHALILDLVPQSSSLKEIFKVILDSRKRNGYRSAMLILEFFESLAISCPLNALHFSSKLVSIFKRFQFDQIERDRVVLRITKNAGLEDKTRHDLLKALAKPSYELVTKLSSLIKSGTPPKYISMLLSLMFSKSDDAYLIFLASKATISSRGLQRDIKKVVTRLYRCMEFQADDMFEECLDDVDSQALTRATVVSDFMRMILKLIEQIHAPEDRLAMIPFIELTFEKLSLQEILSFSMKEANPYSLCSIAAMLADKLDDKTLRNWLDLLTVTIPEAVIVCFAEYGVPADNIEFVLKAVLDRPVEKLADLLYHLIDIDRIQALGYIDRCLNDTRFKAQRWTVLKRTFEKIIKTRLWKAEISLLFKCIPFSDAEISAIVNHLISLDTDEEIICFVLGYISELSKETVQQVALSLSYSDDFVVSVLKKVKDLSVDSFAHFVGLLEDTPFRRNLVQVFKVLN